MIPALALIAIVAWLVAAAAALNLMKYRRPERSVSWYAVRGYAFFSTRNFTPEGARTQRVFLAAVLVFFGALIAAIAWPFLNAAG